jgi:hypothetical protein
MGLLMYVPSSEDGEFLKLFLFFCASDEGGIFVEKGLRLALSNRTFRSDENVLLCTLISMVPKCGLLQLRY